MDYRKKPVVIQAVRWNGDNFDEVYAFMQGSDRHITNTINKEIVIHTLEGDVTASVGDWIIRGVKGEYYPCKPDIFAATYENADAEMESCDCAEQSNDMTFGMAIEAVKAGKKVARQGWNGKGMFVVYQKGYPQGIQCNKQTADAWGMKEGDLFICNPYLQIKQVNGLHSMWVPSIGDVLAEDWMIV
jgi:hypothetical protein